MKIEFYTLSMLLMVGTFSLFYSWADIENGEEKPKIDKYLPTTKGKKMGRLYRFTKTRHPVRYRAYLIEKITQIMAAVYFLTIFLGRLFTGSFDFVEKPFLGMLPMYVFLLFHPCFNIGIRIYVMIKKHQKKQQNAE